MPEKTIKVRGEIETDKDYNCQDEIQVTVEVTSIELIDTQDGEFKKVHKAKLREIK